MRGRRAHWRDAGTGERDGAGGCVCVGGGGRGVVGWGEGAGVGWGALLVLLLMQGTLL
jgi:hypothetical protein